MRSYPAANWKAVTFRSNACNFDSWLKKQGATIALRRREESRKDKNHISSGSILKNRRDC